VTAPDAGARVHDLGAEPLDRERQRETFLRALFDDLGGALDLRFIAPDGGLERIPVPSIKQALDLIRSREGRCENVYVGLATRRTASRDLGAGGGSNLLACRALWVDLDFGDDAEGDREAFEVKLDGLGLPPSMRVASGGGEHAYWLLREPVRLEKPEQREAFEATLRGLADYLETDRAATDAARILRVSGTINHPDAKKREKGRREAPCILLSLDSDRLYSLDTFEAFEARGRAIRAEKAESVGYAGEPWNGELPARAAELLERRPKLRARWEGDTAGLHDTSDSGIDFAIATLLALDGVSGSEIEASLRYRRREIVAKPKHAGYFAQTVGRALAWAQEHREEHPRKAEPEKPPAAAKPRRDRRNGGTPPQAPEDATDDGLAERFARLHADDLVHVPTLRRWFTWDRQRFRADDGNTVRALVRSTARGLLHEIVDSADPKQQAELTQLARKARAMSRMRAALWIAEADPRVVARHEDLDADPWLLNVANGTLDLRTGALREHRRSDRLTRLAPVVFDPAARSPLWESFLERIQPDASMRGFLQRAAGYSLTADASEECMFIAHGTGANGKSTFLETLRAGLGPDYAAELAAGALTLRERGDDLERLLAPLPGVRLATTLELHEGQRLREAAVKHLTSGEPLRARFLYSESFEFRPVAKFWIGTNHRPGVGGDDEGIWRRLRLVPFEVQIPEDQRDKRLREKLRHELPGVLTWAIAGCLEWQRDGLAPPEAVMVATRDYRTTEDVVGLFIEESAAVKAEAWLPSALLHRAFDRWARAAGEENLSHRALADRLRGRGLKPERLGGHRGWRGLDLTPEVRAALDRDGGGR